MSKDVCPFLKKEGEEKYICEVLNTEVNPYINPCLHGYENCPFYQAKSSRIPEEIEEVREEEERRGEEEIEISEERVVEEHPTPERIIYPKPEITLKAEERLLLEDKVKDLTDEIMKLEGLWETYAREAERIISIWQNMKREYERRKMSLKEELKEWQNMLNELEIRLNLGMIEEEVYHHTREKIESEIRKIQEEIAKIEEIVSSIDESLSEHYRRVGQRMLKMDRERIKKTFS